MKKIVLALLMIMLLSMSACSKSSQKAEEPTDVVGMANPWIETDESGFAQKLGMTLNVPEGATDVVFRILESEGLGEMQFTLDGAEYNSRIQAVGDFTDISGMYYDWTNEEADSVSYCDAKVYIYIGEDESAELCLWFDRAPGIMYSLSTTGKDLDGLDIAVIAEQVFAPMQGDAD